MVAIYNAMRHIAFDVAQLDRRGLGGKRGPIQKKYAVRPPEGRFLFEF